MKKYIIAALALLITFTNCSKEDISADNNKIEVKFNVADKPSFDNNSRAVKQNWEEGDQILIAFGGGNDKLLLNNNNRNIPYSLKLTYNAKGNWNIDDTNLPPTDLFKMDGKGKYIAINYPGNVGIKLNSPQGAYLDNYFGIHVFYEGEYTYNNELLDLGTIQMQRSDEYFQISIKNLGHSEDKWYLYFDDSPHNRFQYIHNIPILNTVKLSKLTNGSNVNNKTRGLKYQGDLLFTFLKSKNITEKANITFILTNNTNTYHLTLEDAPNSTLENGKAYSLPAITDSKWVDMKACNLPNGTTFKMAIRNVLPDDKSVQAIKFVAGSSANDTSAFDPNYQYKMPANAKYKIIDATATTPKTLEIHTTAEVFMFNTSCYSMFDGNYSVPNELAEITTIDFNNCINTSNVTDMAEMFQACGKLTSLDLSSFKFKNDVDVKDMFFWTGKATEGTAKIIVDEDGYNYLKDKSTSINSNYAKYVKPDGVTPWETSTP